MSEEKSYELVNGTFKAKTINLYAVEFKGTDGREDQQRLAIEVKFSEGPNANRRETFIVGSKNIEFFAKTLIAAGWQGPEQPILQIKPGVELYAVVDTDVNPKTGKARNTIKYLNPLDGGGGGMQKHKMDDKKADAWQRSTMPQLAAFARSTGMKFSAPPAQASTAAPKGNSGGEDDDVPF